MAGTGLRKTARLTPARLREDLGTTMLAVDKRHLNVLPGHKVIVQMGGQAYEGRVTKTAGDGRVQFQLATPIPKHAKTTDHIIDERRRIIRDFREFHDRLATGSASVHLIPELPKARRRKRSRRA